MTLLTRWLFFLLLFFSLMWVVFGNSVQVQDIFIDIDESYEYLSELQQLYDRGMIVVGENRRFNPQWLLDRDEFVGVTMEVICEKCVQPLTPIWLLQAYSSTQSYFDVTKTNPYFYCIEEANDKDYVRGYGIGVSCEDGTSRAWERPFCPDNRILLEEAIAVLLRNSGIFTIEDNQQVLQAIRDGGITENISPDVSPTDNDGNEYTFYGYLRRALSFQITEFDSSGNSHILRLLEPDEIGNLNPKKFISREEFLRMAYITFKTNNCVDTEDNWFALEIDIWEKECSPTSTNCTRSRLDDPEDIYDFSPQVEWFCVDGIEEPNGYFWRYYNTTNGEEFFRYGYYQDDIKLPSNGAWRIYARITDRCWNSSQAYSTIVVRDSDISPKDDTQIDVSIAIYDGWCPWPNRNCEAIDFYEEWKSGDIFDFEWRVSTSCPVWDVQYKWTFTSPTRNQQLFASWYIDNFEFLSPWEWLIVLNVTDGCGNSGREQETFIVRDSDISPKDDTQIDVSIAIYDGWCPWPNRNCEAIDFYEEWKSGDIFDFEWRVSTSCPVWDVQYKWTFTSPTRNQQLFASWYIDNFEFLSPWEWLIVLNVTDGCGNSGREQETFIVRDSAPQDFDLSVDILAKPIYGTTDLLVDFEGVIEGWSWPYSYDWDFWDGSVNIGRVTDNIYVWVWTYTVTLSVTDSEWRTWSSQIVIRVVDWDRCLQDSDGDGINDCDDLCPTIPWIKENKWCPIFERLCDSECGCPDGYECSESDPLSCWSWVCRPISIASSCLFSPIVGAIFGNTLCNTCPCDIDIDFLASLRRCDLVFPAITSPEASTIFSRWRAVIVPE